MLEENECDLRGISFRTSEKNMRKSPELKCELRPRPELATKAAEASSRSRCSYNIVEG